MPGTEPPPGPQKNSLVSIYGPEIAADVAALCLGMGVEWTQTKLALESQRTELEEKEKPWENPGFSISVQTIDDDGREVETTSLSDDAHRPPEPEWSREELAAMRRAYINHQLCGAIKHTACQLRDFVEIIDNVLERHDSGSPLLILNGEIFSRLSLPSSPTPLPGEKQIIHNALRTGFDQLTGIITSGTSKRGCQDLIAATDSIIGLLEAMAFPHGPPPESTHAPAAPVMHPVENAMPAEDHGRAAALIRVMDVCWAAARASLDQPPEKRRRIPRDIVLARCDDLFAAERPDPDDEALMKIPYMGDYPTAESTKTNYEILNLDIPKDPCPLVWAFKRMQIGAAMLEKTIYTAHGLTPRDEPYTTGTIPPENLTMLVEDPVAQLTLHVVAESRPELSDLMYDLSIGLFPESHTNAPPDRGPKRAAHAIDHVMGLYREVGLEHHSVFEQSCSWITVLESGIPRLTPIRRPSGPDRSRGGKSFD